MIDFFFDFLLVAFEICGKYLAASRATQVFLNFMTQFKTKSTRISFFPLYSSSEEEKIWNFPPFCIFQQIKGHQIMIVKMCSAPIFLAKNLFFSTMHIILIVLATKAQEKSNQVQGDSMPLCVHKEIIIKIWLQIYYRNRERGNWWI